MKKVTGIKEKIYRKDRKDFLQRSQRALIQYYSFASFAPTLRALRLKKI